jgi:hypothetical protein
MKNEGLLGVAVPKIENYQQDGQKLRNKEI